MAWDVLWHPEAEKERGELPPAERVAVDHAIEKLEALGPDLAFPHSSAVKDADRLRELRPRQGRSPWQAFYRQIGQAFVVGAVGPEATVKPRLFARAVRAAVERLNEVEEEA